MGREKSKREELLRTDYSSPLRVGRKVRSERMKSGRVERQVILILVFVSHLIGTILKLIIL